MSKTQDKLSEDELKSIAGGNNTEYRYVFKSGDYVYRYSYDSERLIIKEDIATSNSSYKVKCEIMKSYPVRVKSIDELTIYTSCSDLMMMYRMNGGKISN